MRSTPDLGYTGEYNSGYYTPSLTSQLLKNIVQVTDIDGDPYYQETGGRCARVRLDGSVRRNDCGSVNAKLVVIDSIGVQQGAPLLSYDFSSDFQDQVASLQLPALAGTAPYYLGVLVAAVSAGQFEAFFRVTPYGQWGWEPVILATAATMLAVEDDLFNTAFYPSVDYSNELRLAKADVRLRLLEAKIEPDRIWCDGCVATPDDDSSPALPTSPSGVGACVIPSLVLPATYAAVAQAYARVAGYKDGRLADKAMSYRDMYSDAMRGAIKSLLAINEKGDEIMTRQEGRPERPRRLVM